MTKNPRQFYSLLIVTTLAKLLLNTARRMVYPFAPAFARGLGVDLAAITSVIALNQATAVLGPVGASFADRYGNKRLILIALVLLCIGCFAAGFIPLYGVLMLSLFLAGLAKSIFDPSFQAFIGSHIPFDQRGKFIGITELAWAGATLLGIPLAGLAIQKFSFQTPFLAIGILGMACFFLIFRLMPEDGPADKKKRATNAMVIANWKLIMQNRQVLGILGFAFFMALGSDTLFVVYGAWLEQSYGLSLAAIGLGTILIGIAEVAGEAITAFFSDRVGLLRTIFIGMVLTAGAYFLLPALDRGVPHVLGGLFLVFLCFEFTIVTAMGLATELMPELRASTMSAFYAIGGLGRVAGAFCGGMLWSHTGILAISLIAGACTLAALACMTAGFARFPKP
ncbi:MAG: MFS transporter [Desulfotignum sp.]|nr:MFS transporter [Desulfobacteraceae bacterium]